jgi:hypothetical protein
MAELKAFSKSGTSFYIKVSGDEAWALFRTIQFAARDPNVGKLRSTVIAVEIAKLLEPKITPTAALKVLAKDGWEPR